jgi:hypothetical protein
MRSRNATFLAIKRAISAPCKAICCKAAESCHDFSAPPKDYQTSREENSVSRRRYPRRGRSPIARRRSGFTASVRRLIPRRVALPRAQGTAPPCWQGADHVGVRVLLKLASSPAVSAAVVAITATLAATGAPMTVEMGAGRRRAGSAAWISEAFWSIRRCLPHGARGRRSWRQAASGPARASALPAGPRGRRCSPVSCAAHLGLSPSGFRRFAVTEGLKVETTGRPAVPTAMPTSSGPSYTPAR